MTSLISSAAPPSNPTDCAPQQLRKRRAYVAAHRPYMDYLHLLLDRARLPGSTWALPNVTTVAAMASELRELYPSQPGLNAIVWGRLLHRILCPLLTWHGGYYANAKGHACPLIYQETTIYRLPEVGRSRAAFAGFTGTETAWSNGFEQWQLTSDPFDSDV